MTDTHPPFGDPAVESVFDGYPPDLRDALLGVRRTIFETAADTPEVGRLRETLKWGQPAYLTPETGSGSTLRLGPGRLGGGAIFVHCRTRILSEFRDLHPDAFDYEGNRGIHLRPDADPADERLRGLVHNALTYHLR